MKGVQLAIGTKVRAVRGPRYTLNPEPRFVGRVGVITEEHDPIAGDYPYTIQFDGGGYDMIDACNLVELRI